jgi:hypothetical protein
MSARCASVRSSAPTRGRRSNRSSRSSGEVGSRADVDGYGAAWTRMRGRALFT